nr:RNA-directed DNA polymerase, eukaryota, reverse transcriptase zinc-binding domain protein [Tanacetum cinerariifolium]
MVGDCFMVNIYGPHDPLAKIKLWNRIRDFMETKMGKYSLFGDMNEVRNAQERVGFIFSRKEAEVSNNFIIDSNLTDIPLGGHAFTWMNKQGTKLRNRRDFGPVPFKIFHSWFSREGFDEVINTELSLLGYHDGSSNMLFHEELKVLKQKIKHWHTSTRSNEASKRLEVLKDLKILNDKIEDGSASNNDRELHINLLHEVDKLDNLEAMDTIHKLRLKWDIEGDENLNSFIGSNSPFITLIPKVSNPVLIKDFRPISLINTHYKIIATVLANRLFKVIDKIVSHEQTTFIAGRQILDGPLIRTEVIDWYKKRKKKMLLFKVDFEKAFDSVSWSPTYEFNVRRGLRQRGPLSLFLFSIIMEENIIRIFQIFHLASGLKISIHKSNIYGIGVSGEDVHLMASNTGCSAGSFPFTYLGLPIGSNMSLTANWKTLVDKFYSKLSSWKSNLLSFGGRLTLIKAVLGSLDSLWAKVIIALHDSNGGFDHNGCKFTEISELDINKAKDKYVWSLAYDEVFSVAALRQRINDHILLSLDIKTTWDKTLPRLTFSCGT